VLIICPTGVLVHSFESRIPDSDGVSNISVDTIQGVLNYKRPGADAKVTWTPPSAPRQYDLVLLDEASQYDDPEWERLYTTSKEQPHKPFAVVVADFQQFQPVSGGDRCQAFCQRMQIVKLDTVYRSADEQHLLFLNRLREGQPSREVLIEYFDDRHWRRRSMQECVAHGMSMAEQQREPLTWLTNTNAGSAEVCEAALRDKEGTAEDLAEVYICDPTTKSKLRIVAKPGLIIRLPRNFDKQGGFVNGALAEIFESLDHNRVFTARLLGSGNMVLVCPTRKWS
jgi:hypothetical protein